MTGLFGHSHKILYPYTKFVGQVYAGLYGHDHIRLKDRL